MIVRPEITSYINSLDRDNPAYLENLKNEAISEKVPIIRQETESFLNVILKLKHPQRILEIGTGIGYSALFMDLCLEGLEHHITTIENYEPRIEKARGILSEYPDIELIEGDALKAVYEIDGCFDLIFLDGPKAQYPVLYQRLKEMLAPEGVLIADNVLQDGSLAKSRYAVERRQRTIHERMREFIWEAKHDQEMDACVLTVGDGVLVCKKK